MNRASGLVLAAVVSITGCEHSAPDGSPASLTASIDQNGQRVSTPSSAGRTSPDRVASAEDDSGADATPAPVVQLTEDTFEQQVLMSDRPVLVDFCASWCGPCRRLDPTIDALAREYEGKVTVARVDVDMNRRLAEKYNIRHTPTVIILRQGRVVEEVVGVSPKRELIDLLTTQLTAHAAAMGQPAPVALVPEVPLATVPPAPAPETPVAPKVDNTQASTGVDPIPPSTATSPK